MTNNSPAPLPADNFPKNYQPGGEAALYQQWMDAKAFTPKGEGTPYTIMMPPPNLTGRLHVGHALFVTLEDIMMRFARMQGKDALYLPGTDHAALSLNVVVEDKLRKEGLDPRAMSKEEFLEHCWKFANEHKDIIPQQMRMLGASADWSREQFTLSPQLSAAVQEAFYRLFKDGLIYRAPRIVNWSVAEQTTLSDIESPHVEKQGKLYYFTYFVASADKNITIATTRPETMLGDVAIVVHPKDKRYKNFVGRKAIIPVINREIPILADASVDMDYGSGVVKVTPAHDATDFAIGQRHGLPIVSVIGKDGRMTKEAGAYAGLTVEECRALLVKHADDKGNLEKVEDITHQVQVSERSGTVLQPLVMEQWWLKMDTLAAAGLEMEKTGEVKFIPERYAHTYRQWLENSQDWCLSRQIRWGHGIPAWHGTGTAAQAAAAPADVAVQLLDAAGAVVPAADADHTATYRLLAVARTEEAAQWCAAQGWTADADTLDTWFSSGLWPMSTLGWPNEQAADYQRYYPTDVLETGYDIIFFWVARMLMLGKYFTGRAPFHTVYMHGLVRDEKGQKMSKSRGNVIDPKETVEQHGADTLRFALVHGTTPGNDANLGPAKLEQARNFINKIWNAGRFIAGQLQEGPRDPQAAAQRLKAAEATLHPATRWVLAETDYAVARMTDRMAAYEYADSTELLYSYTWETVCDWYLEMAKVIDWSAEPVAKDDVLVHLLRTVLSMAHPYMPFFTEDLWQRLQMPGLLATAAWPTPLGITAVPGTEEMLELVRSIRRLRSEQGIAPATRVALHLQGTGAAGALLPAFAPVVGALVRAGDIQLVALPAGTDHFTAATAHLTAEIPSDSAIDKGAEKARLQKELAAAENAAGAAKNRLAAPGFAAKAPREIVFAEEQRLKEAELRIAKLKERIAQLG